jgi:hypothetical protein
MRATTASAYDDESSDDDRAPGSRPLGGHLQCAARLRGSVITHHDGRRLVLEPLR